MCYVYFLVNENGRGNSLPGPFHAPGAFVEALRGKDLKVELKVPDEVFSKAKREYGPPEYIFIPEQDDLILLRRRLDN